MRENTSYGGMASRGIISLVRAYFPHSSHGDPQARDRDASYLRSGSELNVQIAFYQPPAVTAYGEFTCIVP
jgi:hypothetical protein